MHADHINGLPGLLSTISAGEGNVLPDKQDPRLEQSRQLRPTEIYGPSGLREFLRVNFRLTHTVLTRPYVVHELLFNDEQTFEGTLHASERQGRDIRQTDGVWKKFASINGVDVSAGPILHTIPCLGYIFEEQPRPLPLQPSLYVPHLKKPINAQALMKQGISNPLSILSTLTRDRQPVTLEDGTVLEPPGMSGSGRKLVVLGDTYDAAPCIPLSQDADLIVHESTNAYLPTIDESQQIGKKNSNGIEISFETVQELAKEHGHSTPQVAGQFAKSCQAKQLVLNHLSVKYPDFGQEPNLDDGKVDREGPGTKMSRLALKEIARLATKSWSPSNGQQAIVARDFLEIEIPRR
ncbi:hypothetical protein OIO90_003523 [Microbotryomycetes sp. JL221]|nr:hypothetical protein OIO90_003523 [Microbotryomycetes sp. JL221]